MGEHVTLPSFNAAAAKLARERSLEFLKKHLTA